MKTLVCHSDEYIQFRQSIPKHSRVTKYKTRAARHKVKEMIKTLPFDLIEDMLPKKISVDYYG